MDMESLKSLSIEVRDLCGDSVNIVQAPIEELKFYKEYIAANKPCIVQGACQTWPALHKWSPAYITEVLNREVPVAITPNGRADAVTTCLESNQAHFALPALGKVHISALFEKLTAETSNQKDDGNANIWYLQQQDDCLRKDFPELLGDVDKNPKWAERLFGEPEAINLWIGGQMSKTSFHKDHYENLFAVICGTKTFTLMPPADGAYRLAQKPFPVAQYKVPAGKPNLRSCQLDLVIMEEAPPVLWSPIDPNSVSANDSEATLYLDPALPKPIKVTIGPGDILYLPSLWHHFVEQDPCPSGCAIAVNFWYDMQFDVKFAYYQHIERLALQEQARK